MEHKIYEEIHLISPKECRKFAYDFDLAIRKVSELDYGFYKIDKKDKHILIMIENMTFIQELTNKGVRVIGSRDALKMEIYDYKKLHDELRQQAMDFLL